MMEEKGNVTSSTDISVLLGTLEPVSIFETEIIKAPSLHNQEENKHITTYQNLGHVSSLMHQFRDYLRGERYVDLRLMGNDGKEMMKCHRLVLAAASPILAEFLLQTDEDETYVVVPDLTSLQLKEIIDTIYNENHVIKDLDVLEWLIQFNVVSAKVKEPSVEREETSVSTNELIINLDKEDLEQRPQQILLERQVSTQFKRAKENKIPQFACKFDKCGKLFQTQRRLNLHQQHFHSINFPLLKVEDLTCVLCGYKAKTTTALEVHSRTHSGEKPFPCIFCTKTFTSEVYLEQHMQVHNADKIFVCNICNKKFQSLSSLSQHRQVHNPGKFVCTASKDCRKTFTTRRYLTQHLRKHRPTSEEFRCGICSKVMAGRHELKCHMRLHTGEKPFRCPYCNVTFRNRSTKNNHVKTHIGEKKAVCDICNHSFIQIGDLRKHLRSHTGEKPYVCKICGRAFARSDYLQKHSKVHKTSLPSSSSSHHSPQRDLNLKDDEDHDDVSALFSNEAEILEATSVVDPEDALISHSELGDEDLLPRSMLKVKDNTIYLISQSSNS